MTTRNARRTLESTRGRHSTQRWPTHMSQCPAPADSGAAPKLRALSEKPWPPYFGQGTPVKFTNSGLAVRMCSGDPQGISKPPTVGPGGRIGHSDQMAHMADPPSRIEKRAGSSIASLLLERKLQQVFVKSRSAQRVVQAAGGAWRLSSLAGRSCSTVCASGARCARSATPDATGTRGPSPEPRSQKREVCALLGLQVQHVCAHCTSHDYTPSPTLHSRLS